ncbi:MAG: ABC transporter substrate-binding protein [Candidatus Heimdallarchaeota archaeon]
MRRKSITAFNCILVFVILCSPLLTTIPSQTKAVDSYFTIVLKCGGGVLPDFYHNYDITYVGFLGGGTDPDFTGVYNENGSLNLFGYDVSMDYDPALGTGKNEWYMSQGALMMPPFSEARIQHYWDWQQHLMDNLCPMLPMFAASEYMAHWDNLHGYNLSKGILQSWGKMSWDGSHTGQNDTSELVIADMEWSNINPLFYEDTASRYISSLCMDPLIWYDNDMTVWPHLAKNYTYVNDTTILIEIRDDIYWQDQDAFTNEPFDVDDVYFSIYARKHLSDDQDQYTWIEDMRKVSDNQLYIYVDGNETTPEKEPYAPSLGYLNDLILPEHYLNQTQLGDGITPDVSHSSWNNFSTNCFGTGLFEITDIVTDIETTLTVKPESWWLNTTVINDSLLDWENRFGDFTGGLTQHRIRIIPDLQTAMAEFEAGKIDLVKIIQGYDDELIQYEEDTTKEVQSIPSFHLGFMGFNMREERLHLGDRRPCPTDPSISRGLAIRKAICYAADRQEINNVLHSGRYNVIHWPIYQRMGIWCNPNIIRYDFDLVMAKHYMALAGYSETTASIGYSIPIIVGILIGTFTVMFILDKKRKY